MTRRWWIATGLVAAAAGCVGGEEPPAQRALLLLDQEAREAGFVVVGAEVEGQALPIAVATDAPVTLAGPDGSIQIDVAEGEIVLVRGADAVLERRVLGEEVDPDRIVLNAPSAIVDEVADGLGAEVREREDGLVEVSAPGVLAASADAPRFAEIVEASVVELVGHATCTTTTTSQTSRALGRVPAAVTETAIAAPIASFEEPLILSAHDADYMDLPAAASCEDSVAGTWVARRYFPDAHDWYFFTMKIDHARGAKGTLRGEMLAHSWSGGPADVNTAQACQVGGVQWVVRMPARGRVHDGRIEFGGTEWSVAESTCGWAPGEGMYNLDQFSGSVAPDGEATWQNDDGGRMVAEPFEFRRISCDTQ